MPIISWLGSTSSPRRAPKLEDVAIVSANETNVIPMAAIIKGPTSANFVHGTDGAGTPSGSVPTVETPCMCSSKTADTTVAPTMPTRTAGTTLVDRGSTNRIASTPKPTTSAHPTVRSSPSTKDLSSGPKPSRSVERAKKLGQLTDDDDESEAVHIADLHLTRE